MIKTLFYLDTLGTEQAFMLALLMGLLFGFVLERAGLGSSRKLTSVFYLRDMTVMKVTLTAVMTAMLGLAYLERAGWLGEPSLQWLPTTYGRHIIGGLLFGIGFVIGGWCPGTAMTGIASGKLDALLFLFGVVGGCLIYNILFNLVKPITTLGERGLITIDETLGVGKVSFIFVFVVLGILCYAVCEWVERHGGKVGMLQPGFVQTFSLIMLVLAACLFLWPEVTVATPDTGVTVSAETHFQASLEGATQFMAPEDLADRLLQNDPALLVLDLRSAREYARFHIRGAVHVPAADLSAYLEPRRAGRHIVLYADGNVHPNQARTALIRQGIASVSILNQGLVGFTERILKPSSLRGLPLTPVETQRIQAWRDYFLHAGPTSSVSISLVAEVNTLTVPKLVETDWLDRYRERPDLAILDLRSQPLYSRGHIPGSLHLDIESLRGTVHGVGSNLLPASVLAQHFGLLGIKPSDIVVLAAGEEFHDATLAALACARLGHKQYAVLNGGVPKWLTEWRPQDTALPEIRPVFYPPPEAPDRFTADIQAVNKAQKTGDTLILDTRPRTYFDGMQTDEARSGHIPTALNRPFREDVELKNTYTVLRPVETLRAAYRELLTAPDQPVIVYSRTGHQASQTYFILTHLLGHPDVKWYDGGWTQWATQPQLPAVTKSVRR